MIKHRWQTALKSESMEAKNARTDNEEERQRRIRQEVFEGQVRVYATLYEKAIAYNNVVIAIGYAGFFGLWSVTKPYLTKPQALLSASMMLISLAEFVLFEVYKAFVTGKAINRRAAALFDGQSQPDFETFISKVQKLEAEYQMDSLRLSRVWPWIWGISVLFGLAALLILLYSFLSGLIRE